MKKQKKIEEANEAQRKKVIVTFDLLGRKVGSRDFFSNRWHEFQTSFVINS